MNVFSYLYNQFTSRLWHQTPPLEPPVYRLPVNAQPPENTPKFTHPPLESSSGQIRLLKISPGDFNDIITCTLNIFDTSIAPESRPHEYIALSYTWGPASPTRQILVNSGTAIVRQNLWEFLVVARELIPDQLVWIDQICINQEDNDDKNHQVRLMSKIYRRASSVIVWLGSPTNDSDLAMDFISRRAFDMTYSIPKRLRNAIRSFFFRPYWSRLWVVQEIKLAQSVTVLCG
ncbi:HET-domain-containing protein, partial [Lojkania enalia]